jgi:RNA polymerase sigma factor (sigma-70 family)
MYVGVRSSQADPLEDATIAAEARFCTLYDQCYRAIHDYCRRRVDVEHVDDAVAETFLVAWRRIDEVPAGRDALHWLYRVAYRVIGHDWRGGNRRRRLDRRLSSQRPSEAITPEDHAVVGGECERVVAALARLKPSDAELLRLVAWEGLSPPELASVLDISPNTASQRLSRARKRLVREFDRPEDPDRSPAARQGGER